MVIVKDAKTNLDGPENQRENSSVGPAEAKEATPKKHRFDTPSSPLESGKNSAKTKEQEENVVSFPVRPVHAVRPVEDSSDPMDFFDLIVFDDDMPVLDPVDDQDVRRRHTLLQPTLVRRDPVLDPVDDQDVRRRRALLQPTLARRDPIDPVLDPIEVRRMNRENFRRNLHRLRDPLVDRHLLRDPDPVGDFDVRRQQYLPRPPLVRHDPLDDRDLLFHRIDDHYAFRPEDPMDDHRVLVPGLAQDVRDLPAPGLLPFLPQQAVEEHARMVAERALREAERAHREEQARRDRRYRDMMSYVSCDYNTELMRTRARVQKAFEAGLRNHYTKLTETEKRAIVPVTSVACKRTRPDVVMDLEDIGMAYARLSAHERKAAELSTLENYDSSELQAFREERVVLIDMKKTLRKEWQGLDARMTEETGITLSDDEIDIVLSDGLSDVTRNLNRFLIQHPLWSLYVLKRCKNVWNEWRDSEKVPLMHNHLEGLRAVNHFLRSRALASTCRFLWRRFKDDFAGQTYRPLIKCLVLHNGSLTDRFCSMLSMTDLASLSRISRVFWKHLDERIVRAKVDARKLLTFDNFE